MSSPRHEGEESEIDSADPPTTHRVNPRTRRVRRAILDAAAAIFFENGADHVTAARVAAEADVARTTIYRHWPTSASLLLATIDDLAAPGFPTADSGDFAADLRSTLNSLCVRLVNRETHKVFAALASHGHDSDEFAAAQRTFIGHLTRPVEQVLEAAKDSGALPADCDCHREMIKLVSPILHEHFLLYNEPTTELVEDLLVPWLAAYIEPPS